MYTTQLRTGDTFDDMDKSAWTSCKVSPKKPEMLLVQIEGWENVLDEDTPAVYCANHESYMVCPPAHALAASMTTPKK
jgi:hypothetical protein